MGQPGIAGVSSEKGEKATLVLLDDQDCGASLDNLDQRVYLDLTVVMDLVFQVLQENKALQDPLVWMV